MPCLSGQFNPNIGILINVVVLSPGLISPGVNIPTPLTSFPALVDTGASMTCISPQVVQTVGLQPMGMHPMVSATHTVPVNVYLVDLLLPFGNAGHFQAGVQVMEFAGGPGRPFQMLLGRDILCRGTFTMSFDGHFTFSL
jgi:aspartyl protease